MFLIFRRLFLNSYIVENVENEMCWPSVGSMFALAASEEVVKYMCNQLHTVYKVLTLTLLPELETLYLTAT